MLIYSNLNAEVIVFTNFAIIKEAFCHDFAINLIGLILKTALTFCGKIVAISNVFYSSEAKNEAKGMISPPALALSRDAIYSALLSSGITVHG
jgi:hypothetical protein